MEPNKGLEKLSQGRIQSICQEMSEERWSFQMLFFRVTDKNYDFLTTETLVRRKRLDKFGEIRQTLMNMSLVSQTKARDCREPWTNDWRCNFLHSTHLCTIQVGQ